MWETSPDVDFTSPLKGEVGACPEPSARAQAEGLPKDEDETPS